MTSIIQCGDILTIIGSNPEQYKILKEFFGKLVVDSFVLGNSWSVDIQRGDF